VRIVVDVRPTVLIINDLDAVNLFAVEVFVTTLDASVVGTLEFGFKWIPHIQSPLLK
jgi:hypothetical protein